MADCAEDHEELEELLSQNELVTFRYYAQHASVPVSRAKEVLRSYAEAHRPKKGVATDGVVHAVYLLGGSVKDGNGAMKYRLVSEEHLTDAKATFEPLTACHIYSLHTAKATSGEPLYVLNQTQDRKLYDTLGKGPNCLLDNRWSSVKCAAAVVRKRKARAEPPAAVAPPPKPAAPPPKEQNEPPPKPPPVPPPPKSGALGCGCGCGAPPWALP